MGRYRKSSRIGIGRTGALLALGVALLIILTTFLYAGSLLGFPAGSPSNSGTAKSTSNTNPALVISLGLRPQILGIGSRNNYTMDLYTPSDLRGNYSLSYSAPGGITLGLSPMQVYLPGAGSDIGVDVQVSTSATAAPGVYNITLNAAGPGGTFSRTFRFQVVKYLVGIFDVYKPANLTVPAGSTVFWVNYNPGNDEGSGAHSLKFVNGMADSGPMQQFEAWAFTFYQVGVFTYYDQFDAKNTGSVTVTG